MPFLDDYSSSSAEVPVAVVTLHDDLEPMAGVFYFSQFTGDVFLETPIHGISPILPS